MKLNWTGLAIAFLILCCSLGGISTVHGQISYGVKADLGLGWMPLHGAAATAWDGKSFPARTVPGWIMQPGLVFQVGGWARYSIVRNFLVETQLTYNQVSGRSRFIIYNTDGNGQATGMSSKLHMTESVHALSLPIQLGLRTGYGDLTAGMQVNALLAHATRSVGDFVVAGNENHVHTRSMGGTLKPFDIGLKVGLITSLGKRFSIEASYYHGLMNIVAGSASGTSMKLRQVSYGLRYRIGNVELK